LCAQQLFHKGVDQQHVVLLGKNVTAPLFDGFDFDVLQRQSEQHIFHRSWW